MEFGSLDGVPQVGPGGVSHGEPSINATKGALNPQLQMQIHTAPGKCLLSRALLLTSNQSPELFSLCLCFVSPGRSHLTFGFLTLQAE